MRHFKGRSSFREFKRVVYSALRVERDISVGKRDFQMRDTSQNLSKKPV
jgi:hypothetical protein